MVIERRWKVFFKKVQNIGFTCCSLKNKTGLAIGDDDGYRLGIYDSEMVKETRNTVIWQWKKQKKEKEKEIKVSLVYCEVMA